MANPENNPSVGRQEHGEIRKYPLEMIVVPGARIQKVGENFLPTEYSQSDGRGMLGGWARVAAARVLYMQGISRDFHFVGGRNLPVEEGANNAEYIRTFNSLPTEATVYRDAFEQEISVTRSNSIFTDLIEQLEPANTTLDEDPGTTFQTLEKLVQEVRAKSGTAKIGIVTNDYHMRRLSLQAEFAGKHVDGLKGKSLFVLSAEQILLRSLPGIYDVRIQKAYSSLLAKRRFFFEQAGIDDLLSDQYDYDQNRWF